MKKDTAKKRGQTTPEEVHPQWGGEKLQEDDPRPEQHKLGGYTTWRARTSCLEELAEPKIKAAVVELLVEVASARGD